MAEPDFGHPYHPYWTLKKSMVKRVFADDIDKDGKQEVLAGVGNMCLHLYDYKGNQRWRLETPYGTFLTFDVLDFDSDGEREIVGGTDYLSCTSVCRVISREGRFKKSFSNDGWTSGLTAMVFADLNGDGRLEMVNGTSVGNLRVFDVETGNVLWQVNLGDEVRGALVTDLNSDGRLKLVTASASTYVCAFQPDGEKVWFRSVGNAIACLSLAEIEGTKYLVVGCEDGQLYLLNPNGSVVCAFGIGSKINELSVQRMKGSEPTQIIVGSEDGILRAIAPAP
jgi:outer membrane protein assembly factor BamB